MRESMYRRPFVSAVIPLSTSEGSERYVLGTVPPRTTRWDAGGLPARRWVRAGFGRTARATTEILRVLSTGRLLRRYVEAPSSQLSTKVCVQGASATPTISAASLSACSSGGSVSNGQTAPPLYSWDGTGAATAAMTDGASGNSGGDSAGSTTWVAGSTCTPCAYSSTAQAPAADPSSSFSTPPAGETQQQGVTQINAAQSSAESAAVDQLLDRRDDSTTTSGGQCCWTTYTPSVVSGSATASGAVATGTAGASASGGGSSAQATTGLSAASTASGGSLAVGATSGSVSASHAASGSGTAVKASGSLTAGNGTTGGNSTGNSSSWATRVSIVGMDGMVRLAVSVGLAVGLGAVCGGLALM